MGKKMIMLKFDLLMEKKKKTPPQKTFP